LKVPDRTAIDIDGAFAIAVNERDGQNLCGDPRAMFIEGGLERIAGLNGD